MKAAGKVGVGRVNLACHLLSRWLALCSLTVTPMIVQGSVYISFEKRPPNSKGTEVLTDGFD